MSSMQSLRSMPAVLHLLLLLLNPAEKIQELVEFLDTAKGNSCASDRTTPYSISRALRACRGGGGGLVAMGEKDFRMKSSRVKAEQVRASGAAIICTACENCHGQLSDLNEHYGIGIRLEFLSNPVGKALVPKTAQAVTKVTDTASEIGGSALSSAIPCRCIRMAAPVATHPGRSGQ